MDFVIVNFALPTNPKKFPLLKLICDTEECISIVPEEQHRERELLRAKLSNILNGHIKSGKKITPFERTILKIHDNCVEFLKLNPNIVILRADKGGATVAMYKDEYHLKMMNILSDRNTYEPLNRSPLAKLEARANHLIGQLCKEEVIDEYKRRRMIAYNTQTPRIYALHSSDYEQPSIEPFHFYGWYFEEDTT